MESKDPKEQYPDTAGGYTGHGNQSCQNFPQSVQTRQALTMQVENLKQTDRPEYVKCVKHKNPSVETEGKLNSNYLKTQ